MIEMPVSSWAQYKTLVSDKDLKIQYYETDERYELFSIEQGCIVWKIAILKDAEADVTDWEDNYKASANQPLGNNAYSAQSLHVNLRESDGAETGIPTNPVIFQDDTRSLIQEGRVFSHAHTHSLSLGATFYHLIRTPNTATRIHYRHVVLMTGSGRIEFYESPTITAIGGTANILNRNRDESDTSELIIKHAPTVLIEGTLIEAVECGSNGGSKITNTASTSEISIILKTNTDYLMKYTSSVTGNVFSELHFWTEVL